MGDCMRTLFIENKRCPFCDLELENGNVICSDNLSIPLLECKDCHAYFYKRYWYNKLVKIAKENNRKLNRDIFIFEEILPKVKTESKPKKKKKEKQKKTKITGHRSKNKYISELPVEIISTPKQPIDEEIKLCGYYKKNFCLYSDDKCKPYSIRCKLKVSNKKTSSNRKIESDISNSTETRIPERFVTAIVLTYNRKCVYEEHGLEFIIGVCKIAKKDGTIGEIKFPASYCPVCDRYFVYKTDFIKAKESGVLLCEVEDKTQHYLEKHTLNFSGKESKVHALGYNVSRQSNYTYEQRKFILANMIENYGITRSDILSIIDVNIARHKNQTNYSNAVSKWKMDREFVINYKRGDCPEVIISKLILR